MTKRTTTKKKTPAKKRDQQLPDVLYIVKGVDGLDQYFGHATFNDFDHGEVVGIYHLYGMRTAHVSRTLR